MLFFLPANVLYFNMVDLTFGSTVHVNVLHPAYKQRHTQLHR